MGFTGAVKIATFGSGQYRWIPPRTHFVAHAEEAAQKTIVVESNGKADPDGPISRQEIDANKDTEYELPPASVVVIRGAAGPG